MSGKAGGSPVLSEPTLQYCSVHPGNFCSESPGAEPGAPGANFTEFNPARVLENRSTDSSHAQVRQHTDARLRQLSPAGSH